MKKILIIEDEDFIQVFLSHLLVNEGYTVCGMADNAEEGYECFIQKLPDLVLMDIILCGDKTGVDCALKIREGFNTPIIFYSGGFDHEYLDIIGKMDNIEFIRKPVPSEILLKKIKKFI